MQEHRLRLTEYELRKIQQALWIRLLMQINSPKITEEEIDLYTLMKKLNRSSRGRTPKDINITREKVKELLRITSPLVPPGERKKVSELLRKV